MKGLCEVVSRIIIGIAILSAAFSALGLPGLLIGFFILEALDDKWKKAG
ncbi:MAG: hypothetical protein M0Z79_04335 [Nitrospiraceae bacterium]|nr:hypothetical protein [Nitrospiraceae bacterium]